MAIKKNSIKTDAITAFPATIIGDGTPITSYTVKGNMEQSGTPTPSSPIYPSECGERTENLFDVEPGIFDAGNWTLAGSNFAYFMYYLISENTVERLKRIGTIAGTVFLIAGGTYLDGAVLAITSSIKATGVSTEERLLQNDGTPMQYSADVSGYSDIYLCIGYGLGITQSNKKMLADSIFDNYNIMLNSGSTALPYEPYGYKLPLTLGSTTTDIYLGEVQSTRRIKKLVLTGEENWVIVSGRLCILKPTNCTQYSRSISTHFIQAQGATNPGEMYIGGSYINFNYDGVNNNIPDFKSYLAAQYTAGTPVTVWYVLAEPTTGIVNEPLRKIGDYVDSVSGTGLATSGTAQELNIETTLKPSEVDMTYHTWISTVPCRKYTKSRNSNSAWVDIPTYTRTDGSWVRDSDTWCYGFKVLKTSDDPDLKVEYLEDAVGMTPASMGSSSFNFGSWLNAPFMPKACMLNFDGTVAYYLDDEDYSKKADGTPSDVSNFDFNGNAMAEYGLLWYKFSDGDENTEFEFRVSNKKLDDDFVCHCNTDSHNDIIDHFYVPIYNGTTAPTYDSTATYDVGAHVVYDGKEYRCITAVSTAEAFDNSKWDLVSNTPRMRSLSGVQLTPANGNGQTSGTEEIARAEACNVGADKEWFIDTLCDHELITMLHVLVAKSLDCQAKFGQGISSGSQTAKESYVTGSLDDKGSFYGSTSATTIAVKTFCRENFWALVWRRMAGLVGSSGNFLYKLTPNTADGSTATSYNTNGSGYLNGGTRPVNGYIKNLKRSTDGFLPHTTSSSSVGTKDYYYDGNGYALVGGASDCGALAGPFSFHLYAAVSSRAWGLSGSPSCKPCKNKTL